MLAKHCRALVMSRSQELWNVREKKKTSNLQAESRLSLLPSSEAAELGLCAVELPGTVAAASGFTRCSEQRRGSASKIHNNT